METRDVVRDQIAITRSEAIQPLLKREAWDRLNDAAGGTEILMEAFSSSLVPSHSGTDINGALLKVLGQDSALRGVVVISDGDWNTGDSPIEAASRYRMQKVPLFAIAAGSEEPLPDLELVTIDAPTFGVVRKRLRLPFVLRSTLGQDRDVEVSLSVNGTGVDTKSVRVPAMGQLQDNLVWTPAETGDYRMEIAVSVDRQEYVRDNNTLTAPISIREEQLKVLVIESYPRWEYRYLRNALERDPGVEVKCVLFHPELTSVGGGRSYLESFPSVRELSHYDVVFLGDVGVSARQLTAEQLRALKQLVSAQASGLVLLPGRYGFQDSLVESELGDLIPVVMDRGLPRGSGTPKPGHLLLTQAGQKSLLTHLAEGDRSNAEIWRSLPGFHWYAGVQKAAIGSEVLAVHESESNSSGRIPLLVTKTFGTGKVLFLGTDSAWRWREGVEDRYHYRFWGQVARWMAYQRQMADGNLIRLFYSPDRPSVDDVVSLNANALDAVGGPLTDGTVVVQATSPTGKSQSIRLKSGDDDAWGLFVGSFQPEEPGTHTLVATCIETGAEIETKLNVQGLGRERKGKPARPEVLKELVAVAGGKLASLDEVDSLITNLADLPEAEPMVQRIRIWAHPAWGGFLIAMMALFWIGRKTVGAI